MHPARRQLVLRLGLCTLLVLAPLLWSQLREPVDLWGPTPPPVDAVYLPTPQELQALRTAVHSLATPIQSEPMGTRVDLASLFLCPDYQFTLTQVPQGAVPGAEAPADEVSLLFLALGNRMAVINGGLYAEGWTLPDGRRVARITRQGVLLAHGAEQRFVPWQDPRRVELRRQEFGQTPQPSTSAAETTTPTGPLPDLGAVQQQSVQ